MSLDREEWRWVPGYEGRYLVSDLGNVASVGFARGSEPYKVLSQTLCGAGYKKVSLRDGVRNRNVMVHRIVAMAFVPNPDNKPVVNHIDGNKLNNSSANLEWVSHSENCYHSVRVLGNHHGGVEHSVKLTQEQAREIFDSDLSNAELSRLYGVSDTMVSRIKRRKAWRSVTCQSTR